MSQTVEINENLLKIENVLTGLEYLMEEVQTRKDNVLSDINFNQIVRNHIRSNEFKRLVANEVTGGYSDSIYREVAFKVMERIDSDIAAFVNARVDERLQELGVIPSNRV